MKPDNFSRPKMLDQQIETIACELEQRQQARQSLSDAPELRLTDDIRHAYQAETHEDQRSLARVLARLVGNDADARPKVIFLPHANNTEKRMSVMQNTMNSSPQDKTQGGWKRRAGLFAAVLCLALLVGGFLTVLGATRAKPANTGTASSQHAQVPPFAPTPKIKTGPIGTIVSQGATYTSPMVWSPTGNRMAGQESDGSLASWDGVTGTNIVKYQTTSHSGMSNAAWSSDGARVAFALADGIDVFNARTGALLESLSLPTLSSTENVLAHGFQGLSWSPDSKYLVTLYSLETGTTLPKYNNPNPAGTHMTNQLYVWDLASNQVVAKSASNLVTNIAWSPDGKYLATWTVGEAVGQNSSLQLWNPVTWQVAKTYAHVADFSWSPDGSQMALIKGGSVQILAAASDNVLRTFAGGHGAISAVTWQPHGTSLLVATYNVSANTFYLSLWNADTGSEVFPFTQYQGASASWSSDGTYVLMTAFNYHGQMPPSTPTHVAWYEVIWIAK